MLRTGSGIPSPLIPCYYLTSASFISRLANTGNIDRPIYGLSAQLYSIAINGKFTLNPLCQTSCDYQNNINFKLSTVWKTRMASHQISLGFNNFEATKLTKYNSILESKH